MQVSEVLKRIQKRWNKGAVRLRPSVHPRGFVLVSYFTEPFLMAETAATPRHTNYWESKRIVEEFLERGYTVDVIDATNRTFIPVERYAYCIDIHANLERLAPLLPKECVKILFTTTSHWKFNNEAEEKRLNDVSLRRGVTFPGERLLAPTRSAEIADHILYLGNEHTIWTYGAGAHARSRNIPLSTTHTYPAPSKDFSTARNGFVWLGGAGVIHKGVDLLVETFAALPEHTLELCGKHREPLFEKVFEAELSKPNITGHGSVDLGSPYFDTIRNRSAFVISPSCAEGQSGAVVVGMHAGLIPIVSKETGIDTHDFGFTLSDCSRDTIHKTVVACATLPKDELVERARKTWEYANAHHTRDIFAASFTEFINSLEQHSV